MGWLSKIKKGFKKATKAVTKAVSDTGKFVKKNGALIASIGGAVIPGMSLLGGLASSPLVKSVGGIIDQGKNVSALAQSVGSAFPGSSGSSVNSGGSSNISASVSTSKAPVATETKKKVALGSVALGALSLLKYLK